MCDCVPIKLYFTKIKIKAVGCSLLTFVLELQRKGESFFLKSLVSKDRVAGSERWRWLLCKALGHLLYAFPTPAVVNHQKRGGLEQHKLINSSVRQIFEWVFRAKTKVSAELCSFWKP